MQAAEQELSVAAAQAQRSLRNFAADLAIEQAAKQLDLTPETDKALIAEFIGERGQGRAELDGRLRFPLRQAFADVVTDAKLDTAALDAQFSDFLATWEGSAELRDFFENPAVPAHEKVAILDKLNAKLKLQKELRNLSPCSSRTTASPRWAKWPQAWRSLLQQQQGIRPAEIVTARALDEKEQAALVAEIAKLAGSKIDASFKLDASILGGTVVRIGSTVYDGSVRGRLERLKEALIAG